METAWLGRACFPVEDARGTRVIVDPLDMDGLSLAGRPEQNAVAIEPPGEEEGN